MCPDPACSATVIQLAGSLIEMRRLRRPAPGSLPPRRFKYLNLTSPSAITVAETAFADTTDGRLCGDAVSEADLGEHWRGDGS
jgi:hypothetical protein